jgi:hypothetical protein
MISFSPQERDLRGDDEPRTRDLQLDGLALLTKLSYATIVISDLSLARGDSNSYDLLNREASCQLNDAPVAPQGVEPCSAT